MQEQITNAKVNSHALIRVQKKGLSICHINAQSLTKKTDEFRFLFVNSSVDIICVSETWFMSSVCDSLILCSGYNVFRSDRQGHAGGVVIYVSKRLKSRVLLRQPVRSAINFLFFTVKSITNTSDTLIGCLIEQD